MLTLGIDTSNYATSLAVYDSCAKEVVCDKKQFLPVKQGQLGLRQSDALFHHTAALPELLSQLAQQVDLSRIQAVGVSTRRAGGRLLHALFSCRTQRSSGICCCPWHSAGRINSPTGSPLPRRFLPLAKRICSSAPAWYFMYPAEPLTCFCVKAMVQSGALVPAVISTQVRQWIGWG